MTKYISNLGVKIIQSRASTPALRVESSRGTIRYKSLLFSLTLELTQSAFADIDVHVVNHTGYDRLPTNQILCKGE